MLLVDGGEQVAVLADALRRAEEQIAARAQRVVEGRDDLVLDVRPEIDQQVAAGDQVHPRERRIADDAVRREDAEVAHAPCVSTKLPPSLLKKRCAALRRNAVEQGLGIAAGRATASAASSMSVAKIWTRGSGRQRVHVLAHQDADGEDLLAGRAARHPDPDRVVGGPRPRTACGMTDRLEHLEGIGVAEEIGDVDQQVAEQGAAPRPGPRRRQLDIGVDGCRAA